MSCTDCASNEIKYKGDGVQTLFTFPFTYIDETDVYVSLWNEASRRYVKTTDWTFANATTVQFNTAPPAPGVNDVEQFNVKISRCTDIDPLAASFYPGSAIRAQDLNNNFEQLQMAIQEGRCQVPDWLFDFLDDFYWNKAQDTTYSTDLWGPEADDKHIPTTGATQRELAARWDKRNETTFTSSNWNSQADNSHVPTTGAVDKFVKDEIKDDFNNRVVTEAEQTTDGAAGKIDDTKIFTTAASVARHDLYHQDPKPTDLTYEQPGKEWFDTATLDTYVWDGNAGAWVDMGNAGPQGPKGDFGPPGKVIIGDNPPTEYPVVDGSPARPLESGDLWWNSKKVNLYIYYVDNTGPQWVSISKTGPEGPPGPPGSGGSSYTFTNPLKDTSGVVSIDLQTLTLA